MSREMQCVRNGFWCRHILLLDNFLPQFSARYIYAQKRNMNQYSCFVRKKCVKNNFKLMEAFILLHSTPMTATVITFSNHNTETNMF